MKKEEWKRYEGMLWQLTDLSEYGNGRKLSLRESKFLNYFGKSMNYLLSVWLEFYPERKRLPALRKIAKILTKLEEIERVKE